MIGEEEIINLENNSRYKTLTEILNYNKSDHSKDFLKDMVEKIQKISQFIRKIKLVEDPKYLQSQNKEYAKLLKLSKSKIEKIILKTILYVRKESNMDYELNMEDFKFVTDFVDDLMEKVSDNIDIIKGKKKDKKDSEIETELKNLQKIKKMENFNLKNKIQLSLEDQFDIDNSYYPFIPKIKIKLNATKELSNDIIDAKRLRSENIEKFRIIKYEDRKENKNMILFEHPYKEEIIDYTNIFASRIEKLNQFLRRNKSEGQLLSNLIKFEKVSIGDVSDFVKDKTMIKLEEIQIAQRNLNEKNYNSFYKYFMDVNFDLKDDKEIFEKLEKIFIENGNVFTFYEINYLSLNETKFTYIDSKEELLKMIQEIDSYAEEVAVDLEHHSLESYLGITCLMQISTRFADYIIDTIRLRPYLHELNKVFTNPDIVKVLHGADFDIEWLQKDFGLYIVNMFDTGQAARILQLPSYSLASLLSQICNISADKKYQLADWRLRPLPSEMMKYAREDTHYLLFIYDNLKRKLIEKSLIREDFGTSLIICYKRSNEIALKQYFKPSVKSEEYYQMLSRNSSHLNRRQLSLLKLLFKFRDFVARKIDLSPHYVLSQRNMFNLVKLPKFDQESLYMNLEKNSSQFRNFVPDLIKLVDLKLIRIEKKIEDGLGTKLLEQNYLDSMRSKLNMSRTIVSDIKMKITKVEKISMNKNDIKENNKNLLVNIKDFGNSVNFVIKEKSKFLESKFLEPKNENKLKNESDIKINYDNVLEKLNNFNIISFLQEKHPNLKVENKVKNVVKVSETKNIINNKNNENINLNLANAEMIPIPTTNINNQIGESFLKQKRKGPDHSEAIDLTDYKRPIHNKESDSEEDEINPEDIINKNKNMQEKEKFIKGLMKMKKSGKK